MVRNKLMNTFVDTCDFNETIEEMKKIIATRTVTQHVVINANKINLMYKNNKLKKIVNHCSLINADGQSIVWANKFLKNEERVYRVTGIDLFEQLVKVSETEGYRVYYLGAAEEVLSKVIEKHSTLYPRLKIVGSHHGYFDKNHCEALVESIRACQPDILFVAFPSPEKEFWLDKYKNQLGVPLQIGVGGSFDVVSGIVKRAPVRMQKMGLEWFYRWLFEPRRLFKRYFVGNFKFLYYLFLERYGLKR